MAQPQPGLSGSSSQSVRLPPRVFELEVPKTDEQWLAFKAAKQGVTLRGDPERLRAEMDELRHRLTEVEERLDFTERLLSKTRDSERLAPPR